MGQPFPIFSSIEGMERDASRDQLAPGMAWNLIDYFPDILQAPLGKRGGYGYAAAAQGLNTYMQAVAYAEYTAGSQVVSIDDQGQLFNVIGQTNPGTTSFTAMKQSPVFHRQNLLIPAGDGTTGPKTYDGTTVSATVASAPTAKYASVFHDFSVLANASGNVNRVWFSNPGDPSTWTTATGGSWVDTTFPVTGLASLRGAVLIFSSGHMERLRGTTPPPGTDMALEGVFDHGCIDARSIVISGDNVIFANAEGVFVTDGAVPKDLTAAGGMSSYWRSIMSAWTSSYTVSAGLYGSHYIVSIMNGATFVDALACNMNTKRWFRIANLKATTFAHAVGSVEELYFSARNAKRTGTISGMFAPVAGNKNDADGTAVTPILETQIYRGFTRFHRRWVPSMSSQTWRFMYLNYDIRDAAADSPSLALSYLTSPEATSYTALSSNPTLSATTKLTRKRIPVNFGAAGIALKIAQTNASSITNIYGMESEYMPREPSGL